MTALSCTAELVVMETLCAVVDWMTGVCEFGPIVASRNGTVAVVRVRAMLRIVQPVAVSSEIRGR